MACLKKVMMLTLVVCGGGLYTSSNAFAQSEAVNADDFLQKQNVGADVPVQAQGFNEAKKELSDVEKGIMAAKAELKDKTVLAKKIALAKEMHKIRPTRDQVNSAVLRASSSLPANQRASFIGAMKSMLNYNAIERISLDAMIETYTLKELDSMVEYYSKPEAKSASDKVLSWARVIQPEIVNMIDKAMMRIRTGQ